MYRAEISVDRRDKTLRRVENVHLMSSSFAPAQLTRDTCRATMSQLTRVGLGYLCRARMSQLTRVGRMSQLTRVGLRGLRCLN